jgi:hypothetical protein
VNPSLSSNARVTPSSPNVFAVSGKVAIVTLRQIRDAVLVLLAFVVYDSMLHDTESLVTNLR